MYPFPNAAGGLLMLHPPSAHHVSHPMALTDAGATARILLVETAAAADNEADAEAAEATEGADGANDGAKGGGGSVEVVVAVQATLPAGEEYTLRVMPYTWQVTASTTMAPSP